MTATSPSSAPALFGCRPSASLRVGLEAARSVVALTAMLLALAVGALVFAAQPASAQVADQARIRVAAINPEIGPSVEEDRLLRPRSPPASAGIYDDKPSGCCVAPSRPGSYTNWGDEISDGARMVDQPFSSRGFSPDFADGARSPGAGFEWRGTGPAGSRQGNWYNPRTGESLHPDLGHPGPIGPHYDYKAPDGSWFRVFPDGRVQPK